MTRKALRASPEAAFAMFSDAEYLQQWFFPPFVTVVKSVLNFQEGGSYLYGMAVPTKPPVWGRLDFESINAPRSIVFIQSVTDAHGRVLAPLRGSDWLLRMKSEIEIEHYEDGAILKQAVSVFEAGPEEVEFVRSTWQQLSDEYEAALARLGSVFAQARQ